LEAQTRWGSLSTPPNPLATIGSGCRRKGKGEKGKKGGEKVRRKGRTERRRVEFHHF